MAKRGKFLANIANNVLDSTYRIIQDPLSRFAAKSSAYPKYKGINIPFINDKKITLTNAGLATGAVISENLLDSIAKYANRAGLPIKTALGLATKESTLGNPTDDATYNILRGIKNDNRPAKQYINNGHDVWARDLVNYYKDYWNPYETAIAYAKKKVLGENREFYRPVNFGGNEEAYKESLEKYNRQKAAIDSVLVGGEAYADRQARENRDNMNINVLEAAFRDYKANPNNYNPGQRNYSTLVNKRANEVWNSPEIQSWYRRSLEDGYRLGGTVKTCYEGGGSIHIAPSKRGTFTAAATKHGMGVQAFARRVLANKGNYSPAMVKKANFARNAAKWH